MEYTECADSTARCSYSTPQFMGGVEVAKTQGFSDFGVLFARSETDRRQIAR